MAAAAVVISLAACGTSEDPADVPAPDTASDAAGPDDPDAESTGTDAPPSGECLPLSGKACNDDNTVVWVDSCGTFGVVFEICGDDRVCQFGQCAEICYEKDKKACHNNNVFWFDSCGNANGVAEACGPGQWCVDAVCNDADYSGAWAVASEPLKQSTGLAGWVEYGGGEFLLIVIDSTITLTADDRTYAGQLEDDGKTFNLTAKWDAAGLSHQAEINGEFTSGALFYAVEKDSITIQGTPAGPPLVWNLSGVKK